MSNDTFICIIFFVAFFSGLVMLFAASEYISGTLFLCTAFLIAVLGCLFCKDADEADEKEDK